MNAVIIGYRGYDDRLDCVRDFFINNGFNITVILPDFLHGKGYIEDCNKNKNVIYIHSDSYRKNLSLDRIKTYIKWSKDAFDIVGQYAPAIIYIVAPPNSLLKEAAKYKKHNSKTKIVAEIFDLWPESLPIKGLIKVLLKPMLSFWKNLRNKNLKYVDLIFSECDYYKQVLKSQNIITDKIITAHLFGSNIRSDISYIPSDTIRFLYLGSINNIIDIEKIVEFLNKLNQKKKVVLNIIGDGEKKEDFINRACENNIETIYHGKIYEDEYKQNIMNNCDFGLNIYKSNIEVGLTIKSIDYFRGGLPIINTIKGDTTDLVNAHNIGFNLIDLEQTSKAILNADNLPQLRRNVSECYNKYFTKEKFINTIKNIDRIY